MQTLISQVRAKAHYIKSLWEINEGYHEVEIEQQEKELAELKKLALEAHINFIQVDAAIKATLIPQMKRCCETGEGWLTLLENIKNSLCPLYDLWDDNGQAYEEHMTSCINIAISNGGKASLSGSSSIYYMFAEQDNVYIIFENEEYTDEEWTELDRSTLANELYTKYKHTGYSIG